MAKIMKYNKDGGSARLDYILPSLKKDQEIADIKFILDVEKKKGHDVQLYKRLLFTSVLCNLGLICWLITTL